VRISSRAVSAAVMLAAALSLVSITATAAPRLERRTIEHDGITRSYLLSLPAAYDPSRPAPLVLAFHGGGQTAKSFSRKRPDLIRRARRDGVILAFPQSTVSAEVGKTRWIVRADAVEAGLVDDVGFVLALVTSLREQYAVDASRIYATGFSNGGNFTHLLATATEGLFAAVAPVAAGVGSVQGGDEIVLVPTPPEPMPIMMINGLRDRSRPYDGGPTENGGFVTSVAEAVAFWTSGNGCAATVETRLEGGGTVKVDRYAECAGRGEVVMVSLELMDHRWPDRSAGFNFDANERILEFFARHQTQSLLGAKLRSGKFERRSRFFELAHRPSR
jgi:polyhydroxybutyrate depolymerase